MNFEANPIASGWPRVPIAALQLNPPAVNLIQKSLVLSSLAVSSLASAQVTLTTLPSWNGVTAAFGFGELAPATTAGQTFLAPVTSTVLDNFSFRVDNVTGTTVFEAFVMAWGGPGATGPVLYQSSAYTITQAGFESVTFNTGGLSLLGGSQYVAFLSVSNVFDSVPDIAANGATDTDAYTDGELVYLNNGSDFGQVTTAIWSTFSHVDLDFAFEMNFSEPAPVGAVPEASTYGIAGTALLALIIARRRRAQAK
jgi:hypothetical protein